MNAKPHERENAVNSTNKLEHPAKPEPPRSRSSASAVVMLVIIGFLLSSFLIILPGFIGLVLVIGGLLFGGIMTFHYLVWGRLLTRILHEESLDEFDGD
ncbi:MAG: hypothetical protein CMJ64_16415 [Planctomycetaceae bacterium]|nr:hypothetical protein [Planctomycetaceae bacterium]